MEWPTGTTSQRVEAYRRLLEDDRTLPPGPDQVPGWLWYGALAVLVVAALLVVAWIVGPPSSP